MRLAYLLFLVCNAAVAQLPVVQLPQFKPSIATPGTLGARYWWIASDNPLNVKVTNWVDRIQGLALTNATDALRPTNSSTGVGFTGSTYLTNGAAISTVSGVWIGFCSSGVQSASCTTGSVWIVFSPQTPSSSLGSVVVAHEGYGLFTGSGNNFQFFGNAGSGTVCAFTPGNTYDVATIKTNANANLLFYTNGIATSIVLSGDYGGNGFAVVGTDDTGLNYKGKVIEIAYFYSNITASTVTILHNYATNTYGFSP